MLRKKSLLSSLTGLTVTAGAIGGPLVEYEKEWDTVVGAAGWRTINDGIKSARRSVANGSTNRIGGSRQTKLYTARNDNVCDGVFQLSRRTKRASNTKITPTRALKRRKLFDIVVILKLGRSVKLEGLGERAGPSSRFWL